jgi:hypothetical protein
MAKIRNNLVLHGLSGMIGRQVVIRRSQDGGYVVSAAPHRTNTELTDAQRAHRERFLQAVTYAKGAKSVPEYEEVAQTLKMSVHNVAMADFMHPPEITSIDVSNYHGDVGQPIVITALDDVKVKSVGVLIAADDGTFVEKGAAAPSPNDSTHWTYTTTAKTSAKGLKIVVDAADLARHVTELTEEVPLAQ